MDQITKSVLTHYSEMFPRCAIQLPRQFLMGHSANHVDLSLTIGTVTNRLLQLQLKAHAIRESIDDTGTATFMAKDRAILFMRYIRKQLALLDEARNGL